MTLILSGSDGLSDVDGTAAAPALRGTDTNTGIFFPAADTIAFAEGGAEAMRIDSSGNVGIGTTSPGAPLSFGSTADAAKIFLRGNTNEYAIGTQSNELRIASYSATTFYRLGYAGTESMRIDSSGNLLVARTSVVNQGRISVDMLGGTNVGLSVVNTNSGNTGNFCNFARSDTTVIGAIQQNGASAVTYSTSSDYRLKEAIAPMTGALAKVALLKPCTYKWKVDGSDGQGFIAHELQEVVEGCVTGAKDAVDAEGNPQYQGIDTSFLVATLTAAIQELKAIVDTQAARITALEAA
jgi:hypothetical protein